MVIFYKFLAMSELPPMLTPAFIIILLDIFVSWPITEFGNRML